MLRGSARAKVDEKGRLKLPSSFRALLDPNHGREFYVTSFQGDCVRIYPMEAWARVEQKLASGSTVHKLKTKFQRALSFWGQTAVMDGQGRILIHPELREQTATQGDVIVLGQQEYLEVWNRPAFEKQIHADPLSDSDLEVLAGLGI